jgi:hypothetical protein
VAQYVSPKSCSCASTALRLGGLGASEGGARICTLCLRACEAGAGSPEVRLLESSLSGGCCLVCSEILCEERCRLFLRGETLPVELWCRVLYAGPLMELRGRTMVLVLGGAMSRKFPPSGVSAPEWLSGRALLMRLSGRVLLTRLSGRVLPMRLLGLLKFTTGGGRSVAIEEEGRGIL